jgi:hypothetical protein
LENHLLNDPGDGVPPLPEERRPPFAIILANTSTTYDTTVTAYMASGEVAIADGSRVVGADSASAGVDLVTVYSQVVSTDGTKLLDISGPVQDIPLPRQSVMTLLMPHRSLPFKETSLTQSAYRVVTTQPIVAYQFNPFCCNYNFTNDASLLLPSSALTEHYMFMGYAVWAGSVSSRLDDPFSGTLTVLATEEDTEVTVQLRPSKDATRPFEKIIYPSSSTQIEGPDADGVIKAIMQPHDVLNIASAGVSPVEDLTGAKISANKPVAAFAGHTCAFVPFSNPACDHLESQLFPLETWGRRFVAAPLKVRRKPDAPMTRTREGTYWKFVAYEDDTRIDTGLNLSPPHVLPPADEGVKPCTQFSDDPVLGSFVLDSGETCEFGTTNLFVIESQKPIMLGAFLSGQNSVSEDAAFGDHAGDPAFFLVPPEEQYRTDYSFLTPSTYFVSYVTVTVRPGFGVALDGQQLDLTQFDYEILPERDIARAHIPVSDGPHYIESAVPFGIVVYGYDDYVSYAYTGGLDLTKLNEFEF